MKDKRTPVTEENDGSEILFESIRQLDEQEREAKEKLQTAWSGASGGGLIGAIITSIPLSIWKILGAATFIILPFLVLVLYLITFNNFYCWGVFGVFVILIVVLYLHSRKQAKSSITQIDIGS